MLNWNARSIKTNKANLEELLLNRKIQIATITETWLSFNDIFNISGYSIIRCDRFDGYGGVAILIRNDIPYKELSITFNPIDFQLAAVNINGISIVAIYLTPEPSVNYASLKHVAEQLKHPYIISGDMNAHSPVWGSSFLRGNGKAIESLLEDFDLNVLNMGQETLIMPPSGNKSIIDLVICSPTLYYDLELSVLDDTFGSNHFPVLVKHQDVFHTSAHIPPEVTIITNVRNWKKTNWDLYKNKLEDKLLTSSIPQNWYEAYTFFHESLTDAISESTPLIKSFKKGRSPTPWWDDDCKVAKQNRQAAIKRYKKAPTLDNYIEANRVTAATKKLFKQKKKDGFRKFCDELNKNTPITKIWENIKRFRKGTTDAPRPHIIPCAQDILHDLTPDYTALPIRLLMSVNDPFLDQRFKIEELDCVLKTERKSSAGPSPIHYTHLRHMPLRFKELFIGFVNFLLEGGDIPQCWKISHIVPILKPGKDQATSNSYRPISLTPCLLKTTEHLVKNKFEWWLERNRLFHPAQAAYRKGHSTQTCLSKLVSGIKLSIIRKQYMVAVFLDITSAYNNVHLPKLANILTSIGVSSKFSRLILQLISDKTIFVKNHNKLHGPRKAYQGLPQGSVLSPILFNIYLISLISALAKWVQVIQYADDIVLWFSHTDIDIAIAYLNRALRFLHTWLNQHNLSLSSSKSKAIIFGTRRIPQQVNTVVYNNILIPYEIKVKFLGVTFDKTLRWHQQVNNTIQKCQAGLNIMKSLTKTRWGADVPTMMLLYKAIVRPHLDYVAPLIHPLTKTLSQKLERIQFQSVRLALGALRSSPTNALLVEAGEMPITLRASLLCTRLILKQLVIDNNYYLDNIERLRILYNTRRSLRSKTKPLLVEQFDQVTLYKYLVSTGETLPCFTFSYFIQILPLQIDLQLELDKNGVNNNTLLQIILETKYPNLTQVYTDASKTSSSTSCGIFIPQHNIRLAFKIPEEASIAFAELAAVHRSIDLLTQLPVGKYIILSDSRSGLQLLQNNGIKANTGHLVLKIKQLLAYLQLIGYQVYLAWIPGHTGIEGNEQADLLATSCAEDAGYDYLELPSDSLTTIFKQNFRISWQSQWDQTALTKGRYYKQLAPTIPAKPWFQKLALTKNETSMMVRLRLNHTLALDHLFRFNIVPSNICRCGAVADVEHLLFACPIYIKEATELYFNLADLLPLPLSQATIAFAPTATSCKLINSFTKLHKVLI